MKSAVLGLVILGFNVSAGASVRAEDQEPRAKFHLLIKDMLKERQKVRSGEVRIRGNKSGWENGVKSSEGDVRATYYFDAAASSYRYEQIAQADLVLNHVSDQVVSKPGTQAKRFDVRSWCCLNPLYYATTGDIPESKPYSVESLTLLPPAHDAERKDNDADRGPFDPLASGLSGYFESLRGETAGNVYQGMQSRVVESYQLDGSTATIRLRDNTAKDTLVVDLDLLAPLKLTSQSLLDTGAFTSTAKWKRVGDVVIPTEFTIRWGVTTEDGELACGREFQFAWSRINEPFQPEEFEFRAFRDLPVNVLSVFDDRGPAVRYLGTLTEGGEIVIDARDIPEPKPPRFRPKP